MNRIFEFFSQGFRVFGVDSGGKDVLLLGDQSGGNLRDLGRRFTRTVNNFRETFAESAVRVHLREAEVRDRSGLKRAQYLIAIHLTITVFFE